MIREGELEPMCILEIVSRLFWCFLRYFSLFRFLYLFFVIFGCTIGSLYGLDAYLCFVKWRFIFGWCSSWTPWLILYQIISETYTLKDLIELSIFTVCSFDPVSSNILFIDFFISEDFELLKKPYNQKSHLILLLWWVISALWIWPNPSEWACLKPININS